MPVAARRVAKAMSIDVRHLRAAVVTAETQSFSRAAKRLHVKQSALSRRVQALEQMLGVQLFERTKRGTFATENGKAFLTVAARILTDVDNLLTTAKNVSYGEQGRLAVGFKRCGSEPCTAVTNDPRLDDDTSLGCGAAHGERHTAPSARTTGAAATRTASKRGVFGGMISDVQSYPFASPYFIGVQPIENCQLAQYRLSMIKRGTFERSAIWNFASLALCPHYGGQP
jgi:molybdenum-dependent DNA-binding transcriptional regulator ModE